MKKLTPIMLASCLYTSQALAQITIEPYMSLNLNLTNSNSKTDYKSTLSTSYLTENTSYQLITSEEILDGGVSIGSKISFNRFFLTPEIFYQTRDKESYTENLYSVSYSNSTYDIRSYIETTNGDEYGANLKLGYSNNNGAIYAITGIQKRNVTIEAGYNNEAYEITAIDKISFDDIKFTYGLGISKKISNKISTSLEYKLSERDTYSLGYSYTDPYNNVTNDSFDGEYTDSSLSLKIAYHF